MDNNIFLQLSALLGVTISIAFLVRLMRQPLVVAYIVAGIVGGPLFLNLLEGGNHLLESFAQFGIVLLLFVLGLNLDFSYLKKIGLVSAITGVGQILFTFTIGAVLLHTMGFDLLSAAYLALAITFSSTIILVKLLSDKRDTDTIYGRHTIGLMLVQDIIAIIVLLVLTSTTSGSDIPQTLSLLLLKGVGAGVLLIPISRYLLPRLLDGIAGHGEFLFIFTVAWCFGVSSLMFLAGFSIEIGAVVAGLTLGSSPYQKVISSRVKPLRDFFIVLFFIILGSEMGMTDLGAVAWPGFVLSVFILVGKPFILYVLFRLFRFTRKNSFLAGVTAAQVSEFGFILVFMGQSLGHVSGDILPVFTFVALVTIFSSSYMITYSDRLLLFFQPFLKLFGRDRYIQREHSTTLFDVWIFGYHRMGWKIGESLREKGVRFAVVDFDYGTVDRLKRKGIPAFFGDVSDVEFLEMLPLLKSRMIISTFPDPDDQRTYISYVRSLGSKAYIVATLDHSEHMDELYSEGADYVLMPHLLGGEWIHENILGKRCSRKLFSELRTRQAADVDARRRFLSAAAAEVPSSEA